jgi:RNA polymerase sigma-70 factor (ECF subfamily)
VVELQRALALAELEGPERGLAAIRAIASADRLATYPFYFAALGELELRRGEPQVARGHFAKALAVARSRAEREFLQGRIAASGTDSNSG